MFMFGKACCCTSTATYQLTHIYLMNLQMADKGVVSRFRGNELHCNECIRVTIGLPEENVKFLELLKATYAELNN